MTNLIKIDFTPVSDFIMSQDVEDDLLDQFEFLALNDDYNLDDFKYYLLDIICYEHE